MGFRNVASVQELCVAMGLSPVDGSYEKALALNVGASAPVNGSWLNAALPLIKAKRDALTAQTYAGIYGYGDNLFDIGQQNPIIDGNYYYAYNQFLSTPDGINFVRMGLYLWSDIDGYIWQSNDIISYFDNNLMALLNINTTDDVQSKNITTVTAQVASIAAPSFNNAPARSLNTSFRPSTTKGTRVSYTVSVTTPLSVLNLASAGQVFLEISANNSTWTTINSAGVSKTLGVGIALNEVTYFNVQGEIPINYYVRLRTTASGGATIAFVSGQEVTY